MEIKLVLAWSCSSGHIIRIFISSSNTTIGFDWWRMRLIWPIEIMIEWLRSFYLTNCNTQAVIFTVNTTTISTRILLLHPNLHHLLKFILFTRLQHHLLVQSLDYFLLQEGILIKLWKVLTWVDFIIACLWQWYYQTSSQTAAKKNSHDTNI